MYFMYAHLAPEDNESNGRIRHSVHMIDLYDIINYAKCYCSRFEGGRVVEF